jgi:hypothetical protein
MAQGGMSNKEDVAELPPWIASFAAMHKRLCELEHQSRLLREEILCIRRSIAAQKNEPHRTT